MQISCVFNLFEYKENLYRKDYFKIQSPTSLAHVHFTAKNSA